MKHHLRCASLGGSDTVTVGHWTWCALKSTKSSVVRSNTWSCSRVECHCPWCWNISCLFSVFCHYLYATVHSFLNVHIYSNYISSSMTLNDELHVCETNCVFVCFWIINCIWMSAAASDESGVESGAVSESKSQSQCTHHGVSVVSAAMSQ